MKSQHKSFILQAAALFAAFAAFAYDTGDYVQDGLVIHLDGIRNAGVDAEHDSTAVTWANLADESNPAEFH